MSSYTKDIAISGSLQNMVKYCTAVFKLEEEADLTILNSMITDSPIFENKNFYTNILGTVQKTTVSRNSKLYINKNIITFQIRYEIMKVVDINLTEKDEQWIDNDIEGLIKHLEVIISNYTS